MIISALLDTSQQLNRSTCCLWILRPVWPIGIFVLATPRSTSSLYSALKLPRFGYGYTIIFPQGFIHSSLYHANLFSAFSEVGNVSLPYKIAVETVLLKRLWRRVLPSFALNSYRCRSKSWSNSPWDFRIYVSAYISVVTEQVFDCETSETDIRNEMEILIKYNTCQGREEDNCCLWWQPHLYIFTHSQ